MKDVQGLPPRDVLLILEPPGGSESAEATGGPPILRLRLAADPNAPRIHLQQGRVKRHDGPIGPFFQALETELLGAEFRRIAQVQGDRIVIVEFKAEGGKRALLVELFGRRANAALVGAGDKVIATAMEPPRKAGTEPRLVLGQEWKAPGMGAPPSEPGPSIEDAFPAPTEAPPGKAKDRAPLSWRVESHLGQEAEEAHAEDARRTLRQRVKRRIGRAEGLLKGLHAKAEAASNADRVRQDGELLKGLLGTLERGLKSVEVQDWFEEGAPMRTVELDPKLSPNENVQKLFDRYHKLERAQTTVLEELDRAETRLLELQALAERAEDTDLDAEAVDDEAVAEGLLDRRQIADARKKKKAAPRKPYRSFVGCKGSEIRVGRTARDNDTLSIRLARGSDYWLHTADVPGSHVILVTDRGQEPHQEEILDAAHLAIHFSPVRGTDRAPVHVVQRKHLHKPKGAKPGLVTLSGGRILEVRVQTERLNALLRAGSGPSSPPRK
ncbi:MAG: putative ribosome quality control (RQC) complex YloA/Tae2 family protein [Planctomycetota bacterium]